MRRNLTRILLVLFGILLIIGVALCVDLARQYSRQGEDVAIMRRYVYFAPNQEELFWSEIALGIVNADQESSSDTLLVEFNRVSDLEDALEEAVLTQVDGIVMTGITGLNDQIQEISESGIPVIFVNDDVEGSGRTCYIGTDNYKAGMYAGEALADLTEGSGKLLIIVSEMTSSIQEQRLQGLQKVLGDYPQLEIVEIIEDHGSLLELKEKLFLSLQKNPDVTAIVSTEGVATDNIGSLLNQEEVTQENLTVVAFDLTDSSAEYIRTGVYNAVIMLDPYGIGFTAISLLNDYYENGTAPDDTIYIDTICVTVDNIDEYERAYEREELEWNSYG